MSLQSTDHYLLMGATAVIVVAVGLILFLAFSPSIEPEGIQIAGGLITALYVLLFVSACGAAVWTIARREDELVPDPTAQGSRRRVPSIDRVADDLLRKMGGAGETAQPRKGSRSAPGRTTR